MCTCESSLEDKLIHDLDVCATEYDIYEYGLPIHDNDYMNKMRELIKKYANNCRLTSVEPDTTGVQPDHSECGVD